MIPTSAEQPRWQLAELYASNDDPGIQIEFDTALAFAVDFERRFRGRIASLDPAEFTAMMRELEHALEASAKPALYAQLLHSQSTVDPAAGRLIARVREAGAQRGVHLIFFSLELAALSDAQAERLYADPDARAYRHLVERERSHKRYQLSSEEERVLTDFTPVGAPAWVRLFSELCAAIRVQHGDASEPLPSALAELRGTDREARRQAAAAITAALDERLSTRAYIVNVVVQDKAISDRLRGYPSWISSRNLSNEISDQAVEALVDAVTSRAGVVARYYDVKRRLLGLEEMHEWDRDAPVADDDAPLEWSEARGIVLDAYHSLSPRAGEIVQEFFDSGWIDAPTHTDKQQGAYCAQATPSLHPFVMLNFTGRLKDALTLAHELGHGLHFRLARDRHLFDYTPQLTLAETASVFGETLVLDRILDQQHEDSARLSLRCQQAEDAFMTIFRQVAFHKFEGAVHQARRTEGELSAEDFARLWQANLQPMFGSALTLSDGHANWWSYVEHFVQTPGYVYAYAFGKLLALSIYRHYRETGAAFVDRYLEFLSAGGSTPPAELIASLGLDIGDPGFWHRGLDIVDEMVADVERLAARAAQPAPGHPTR